MPAQKQRKPFGLWSSPIEPMVLSQRIRLDDLAWDSDGETLVWIEGRSDQSQLVAQTGSEARRELTQPLVVRGGVGYGGGALTCANGQVYFCEKNGQLYTRSIMRGTSRPLTPPFGAAASPCVSPDGQQVAYVFSDGNTDLLGLVDAAGKDWPVKLSQGADFYMQPAWHPSGTMIAWVEWDHPNMPWDGSRIKLAHLTPDSPRVIDEKIIAGDAITPTAQPIFSPDGNWLCFIEADGEWEQLVLLQLQSGERKVLLKADGFHLMEPAWVQGIRWIAWASDSRSVYSIRSANGINTLWQVGLDGQSQQIDTTPYTSLAQLTASSTADEKLAFLASSPSIPPRLIVWDGKNTTIIARSSSESIPAEFLPTPQPISWQSAAGSPVFGLFYPPANPNFYADGTPPAIVNIHGGPTGGVGCHFNSEAAYFTSRGYAYLEVNYRGSSGYGRSYRDALKEHWGDFDVEDAVSGGQALAERGLADGKRLIIKGGSAGGYTVLNSLVRYPGRFKAAICLYGVSNLFTLDLDTHKFEAHYTQSLVGELPEAAGKYHNWSPVFHGDRIRDPLYIFQGSEDKVVPPSQSDEIVASLQKSGVAYQYKIYPGEGHGFRKSENIADYLKETERFLMQHVLFSD
jgi:dipeptidyl aminopeptidase/acylaminoacyl peptidase